LADKFTSGRLLQAAWLTPSATKQFGIEKAIEYLPQVRSELIEIIKESDKPVPSIFIEFFLMSLTSYSLSSTFLQKENEAILANMISVDEEVNIEYSVKALYLYYSIKDFIDLVKKEEYSEKLLKTIKKSNVSLFDERKLLQTLAIMNKEQASIQKSINRRVKELEEKEKKHIIKKINNRAKI